MTGNDRQQHGQRRSTHNMMLHHTSVGPSSSADVITGSAFPVFQFVSHVTSGLHGFVSANLKEQNKVTLNAPFVSYYKIHLKIVKRIHNNQRHTLFVD